MIEILEPNNKLKRTDFRSRLKNDGSYFHDFIKYWHSVFQTGHVVVGEVQDERMFQLAKWGDEIHDPSKMLVILGEEFGEACKAHLEGDRLAYRQEMIEVAAVAVRAVQAIDRTIAREKQVNPFIDYKVGQRVQHFNNNMKPALGSKGRVIEIKQGANSRVCVQWDHGGHASYEGPKAHRELCILDEETEKVIS